MVLNAITLMKTTVKPPGNSTIENVHDCAIPLKISLINDENKGS